MSDLNDPKSDPGRIREGQSPFQVAAFAVDGNYSFLNLTTDPRVSPVIVLRSMVHV